MAAENAVDRSSSSSKVVLAVDRHLKVTSARVVVAAGRKGSSAEENLERKKISTSPPLSTELLARHIDLLGAESAKAQQLQVPITSALKLTSANSNPNKEEDDVLYLLYEVTENKGEDKDDLKKGDGKERRSTEFYSPLGLLRFGHRKLYCSDGTQLRLLAHCPAILDFYVRQQRRGHGRLLFDSLLSGREDQAGLTAGKLAYDRPSPAMVAFLGRHYSLASPRRQHNHYVIFDDIWRP